MTRPITLCATTVLCTTGASNMKRLALIGCLTSCFVSLGTVAVAHHSFAMFDRSQTKTITGMVKELDMINPHGWLRMMVADDKGVQNEWSLELGGAGQLERSGWTRNAIHPGDKIVVQLHPLRDGSYGGQLISVTLPNGQVLGGRRAFGP